MSAHENSTVGALLGMDGYIIFQHFNAYSGILISTFGTVCNCINIRTFLAMGIKDGVIVSFLSLSIADLLTSIMTLILSISVMFHALELSTGLLFSHDPRMLAIFTVDLGFMTYVVTVLTTLYIAVARCLCVARPLHFKNIFSRSRSIAILASFYVLTIAGHSPLFANQRSQQQFLPSLNRSRYVLWLGPDREKVKDGLFLVTQTVIPFVTEFTIIFCVVVMIGSLRKASKFRRSTASKLRTSWKLPDPEKERPNQTAAKRDNGSKRKKPSLYAVVIGNDNVTTLDLYEDTMRQHSYAFENKAAITADNKLCPDTPRAQATMPESVANDDNSVQKLSDHAFCISKGDTFTDSFNRDVAKATIPVLLPAIRSANSRKTSSDSQSTCRNGSQDCGKELILGLSGKDLQVVNQVVLISIIFIVLNTPSMINGVIGVTMPDYDADWEKDRYVRLYLATSFLRRVIEQVNCSLNIFIYYKYNAKFRKCFWPKCRGRS